jgi:hypothetical protein
MRESEWTAKDSQDNALATAAKAAVAGKRHCINTVIASFSAAAIKLLQVKEGTTVILEQYVHNAEVIQLDYLGATGNALSAELAASGTGGVLGKVAIVGYTE